MVDPSQARRPEPVAALQPVANQPIICHALQALLAADVTNVSMPVPEAVAADVRSCIEHARGDLKVSYIPYGEGNVDGALRHAAEAVGDAPCIMHMADGLLAQPLAPYAGLLDSGSADLLLFVQRETRRNRSLGPNARRVLHIEELESANSSLAVTGVSMFASGAFGRACDGVLLTGEQDDLIAMADGLVMAGGRMEVKMVHGWRRYAGQVNDLLELNRAMLDLLSPEHPPSADDGNEIEGRVSVHPTARVTSSVIVGPVVIGAGARIASAYIGPYTSIGSDARIEGAEIERSIVSREASIMHVEGRIVSSFVGARARVHRDFSLPRAIRLRVGENVEVALP